MYIYGWVSIRTSRVPLLQRQYIYNHMCTCIIIVSTLQLYMYICIYKVESLYAHHGVPLLQCQYDVTWFYRGVTWLLPSLFLSLPDAHVHARTYTHTHTHACTCTGACARTHMHAHVHAHTFSSCPSLSHFLSLSLCRLLSLSLSLSRSLISRSLSLSHTHTHAHTHTHTHTHTHAITRSLSRSLSLSLSLTHTHTYRCITNKTGTTNIAIPCTILSLPRRAP